VKRAGIAVQRIQKQKTAPIVIPREESTMAGQISEEGLGKLMVAEQEKNLYCLLQQRINRSQAIITLQPIIGKLHNGGATTDFIAEVETAFTRETVRVLPHADKIIIRFAAEATKNKKVQEWITLAKDDKEIYTWMEPVYQAHAIIRDLQTIANAALPDIKNLLHPQIRLIEKLFEAQEQLICKLENAYKSKTAGDNSQIIDPLIAIGSLEERPAGKKGRAGVRKRTQKSDEDEERTPPKRRVQGKRRVKKEDQ
jgi:hypothetical protein